MCGELLLEFLVSEFVMSLLSAHNFWTHVFEWCGERKTTHIMHVLPPSDVGATILRMTVKSIVHRHPLSSSTMRRACARSPSQSRDRCLPRRRPLSWSSAVVVAGCLSTTSQFIVVVRRRCRSWSSSWQTSRSSTSPSSAVVVRCHHWIQEAKWREWHGGVFSSFSEQNDTHTRMRPLLAPCMSGTLMEK